VPAVAVVGARRASEYGRRIADQLAQGLAQAGVTVVSGLAAGIDAAAHRGALAAGGRTVAVLGTGIDRVYPSWHRELAAAVADGGALVSEFPCGAPPLAFHFPRRNRLIAEIAPQLVSRVAVARAEAAAAGLTPAERVVLEAVGGDGRHVDEVIRHAAVPPGAALETLLALELRGLVRQLPKRFRRAA
jgi:DNA protecting protein DprA